MLKQPSGYTQHRTPRILAGVVLSLAFSMLILYTLMEMLQNQTPEIQKETGISVLPGSNRAAQDTRKLSPSAQETEDMADSTNELLLLINSQNPLPMDYKVTLTKLRNGQSVDCRAYPDLQAMMDDCRAAGLKPLICSSYRSEEKQRTLYENKIVEFSADGLSDSAAREAAARIVAIPGTSEHQTGLALDIVDMDYQLLNEAQEDTPVQKWMMENCWRYGFILRYPSAHSNCTCINYEPWHYRYVGTDAAKAIYEQGLCLEEYLDGLN